MPFGHCCVDTALMVNIPYSIILQNCVCVGPNILSRVNALTCRSAKAENNMGLIFSVSKQKFKKIMSFCSTESSGNATRMVFVEISCQKLVYLAVL